MQCIVYIPCACVHIQSHSKIVFKKRATNRVMCFKEGKYERILKCPSEVILDFVKTGGFCG